MDPKSKYVIYSTEDFHIIDTAESIAQATDRTWWRRAAKFTTREHYENVVVPENVVEVP